MKPKFSLSIKKWLVIALVASTLTYYWLALRPLQFDSGEWKRAREAKDYRTCYRMSRNLVQKLSGESISWEQLIDLLGKPDFSTTPALSHYKLTAPWFYIFPNDFRLSIMALENREIKKVWVTSG
jgi:hypothetical protein